MDITQNSDTTTTPNQFVARIGFDWGDREHAFYLFVAGAAQPESGKLKHSAETLHRWFKELEERFGGRPVALALESNRGGLLHVLTQYPWLTIFPINPVTSARYRTAFVPSGAKDDLPDASVLLDLVRFHSDKLRPLVWEEAGARQLPLWSRSGATRWTAAPKRSISSSACSKAIIRRPWSWPERI